MPVKDGVWEPWKCFQKEFLRNAVGGDEIEDCDGVMVLVDVKIGGGQVKHFSEDGHTGHEVSPPTLTKVWACNAEGCGFVFEE